MEYVQERVTTLHAFTDPVPEAPVGDAAVVVPMTQREHASLAAERVLTALEDVTPSRVVVALRADADTVGDVDRWLSTFSLDVETCWCDGPRLQSLLADSGLNGRRGKGSDVWLALGLAAESPYVAVHDADAKTYSRAHVPRLLFPLEHGYGFSKGYYARVENRRLYGRLFRLFYTPMVRTLAEAHDAEIIAYLAAFRYALAGEFAATSDVVRSLRVQRGWGLEVGTLGDAFHAVGTEGSAQVDLGIHEHDHRAVGGPEGLETMSEEVSDALLRTVEEGGVSLDYDTLVDRYRDTAETFVRKYTTDSAFNGLSYDRAGEREQVENYASAVSRLGEDTRLPAWDDAPVTVDEVREAIDRDLAEAR
jgi:glucosyl-3-phosphoglycerate synthase